MAAKKTKTDKTKETPKPEVAEAPKAETAKPAKKKVEPKPKKTSALDATAKVLGIYARLSHEAPTQGSLFLLPLA